MRNGEADMRGSPFPQHEMHFDLVAKPQLNGWFDDLPSHPGLRSPLLLWLSCGLAGRGWNGTCPGPWRALVIEHMV